MGRPVPDGSGRGPAPDSAGRGARGILIATKLSEFCLTACKINQLNFSNRDKRAVSHSAFRTRIIEPGPPAGDHSSPMSPSQIETTRKLSSPQLVENNHSGLGQIETNSRLLRPDKFGTGSRATACDERSFNCDSRLSKCDGKGRKARVSAQDNNPRRKANKRLIATVADSKILSTASRQTTSQISNRNKVRAPYCCHPQRMAGRGLRASHGRRPRHWIFAANSTRMSRFWLR